MEITKEQAAKMFQLLKEASIFETGEDWDRSVKELIDQIEPPKPVSKFLTKEEALKIAAKGGVVLYAEFLGWRDWEKKYAWRFESGHNIRQNVAHLIIEKFDLVSDGLYAAKARREYGNVMSLRFISKTA